MGAISLAGKIVHKSYFLQKLLLNLGGSSYRILYYHMVSDNTPDYYFSNKGITYDGFYNQIYEYKKRFKFIPLSEAVWRIDAGKTVKNCISVTTDDGFVENYNIIAPFLLKENINATFFLINNCIDNKSLMWRNKQAFIHNKLGIKDTYNLISNFAQNKDLPLPCKNEDIFAWSKRVFGMKQKDMLTSEIWEKAGMEPINVFLDKRKPYMTTEQIKDLVTKGFEIGAHTNTHPFCNMIDYDLLKEEVIGSIREIKEKTGYNVNLFSYPFGYRASMENEKKLILEFGKEVKALIGIKNVLKNKSVYKLERDMQETTPDMAAFRFYLLPYFRKFANMGNGKYEN